jgi:hypothetical protein
MSHNILVGGWIGRDISNDHDGVSATFSDKAAERRKWIGHIVRKAIGNALEDTIFDLTPQF